jgi:hypothetical protein
MHEGNARPAAYLNAAEADRESHAVLRRITSTFRHRQRRFVHCNFNDRARSAIIDGGRIERRR